LSKVGEKRLPPLCRSLWDASSVPCGDERGAG